MRKAVPRQPKRVIPNPTPPECCGEDARLTTGREIYPHRPDLNEHRFWKCDRCGAYCGVHKKTWEPLGTPAGPELREARGFVHGVLDPIWAHAWTLYPDGAGNRKALQQVARGRVYAWLADRMGLEQRNCHTAMFDIEQCRVAYRLLRGASYSDIREWARARKEKTDGKTTTDLPARQGS